MRIFRTVERMRIDQLRAAATNEAVPHEEWPAVVLRRRVIVCIVLVAGAALMAYALTRPPGDASFYWLTISLAVVWIVGSLASGPLHLGRTTWRSTAKRPVITGAVTGLLLGGVFLAGGLVVRNIPAVAGRITEVLEYTRSGQLGLIVLIALVNGVAEELFFRGALYTALGRFYPVAISTALYTAATLATGNPVLAFAGLILGTVCGLQRRATGGVLAPVLTHAVWGVMMVLALPPIFGL
ncbi:MAG: CPBP family intramembrane metalloprotease [Mycobacterium sp.]|nr:CPBP family intramembrane metalloprotease [Mycobacterium sp.]